MPPRTRHRCYPEVMKQILWPAYTAALSAYIWFTGGNFLFLVIFLLSALVTLMEMHGRWP